MSASKLPSCPSFGSRRQGEAYTDEHTTSTDTLAPRFTIVLWIHLRVLEPFDDVDVRSSGMCKELSTASSVAFLQQRRVPLEINASFSN